MALVQGLVIALAAVVLTPGYLFYFDVTPKVILLLAGTATVLAWAAFAGVGVSAKSAALRGFSLLVLLNILSLALSTVLSARPALSLFGTNWRRFGSVIQAAVCLFAWLIAVSCAGRPDRVRTILRAVTVAGALSGLYGIAQYLGWDPILPSAAYHIGEGLFTIVRPPGTLGQASYFATWLLFVVFLSLALKTMEISRSWRWMALATAVAAGCALWLTGARAAMLGLIAGGASWTYVKRVRLSRRGLLITAAAAVALLAFYLAPSGQLLRARAKWFADDPLGGSRLGLWRDSLSMAMSRLPAGYGPEVFTAEFTRFKSVALAQAYPDFTQESPHNILLDALVAQGLPGLALLVALCAGGFFRALRLKQPAFVAALAAGIVSQQFSAFVLPNAIVFWLTPALLAAWEAPTAEPRRRLPVRTAAVLVAVALVYAAARLGVADHALATTQQQLERGDLRGASEAYLRYESARLPGESADLWYSRALLGLASRAPALTVRLAAVNKAGAAAVRATHSAEDPFDAWYNLAALCGAQNNPACVERSLREAIAGNPTWFKPHWALAEVLRLTGRMDEAWREAVRAAQLDAGKHIEVKRTLENIRSAATQGDPVFHK